MNFNNDTKEKPNYYAILPATVRYNKNLKPNEKILFSDLIYQYLILQDDSLDLSKISKLNKVSKPTVQKWIKSLQDKKLIFIKNNDISDKLKEKKLNGFGFGKKECQWCKIKTSVLHNHHYPIPKSKGGEKVVQICPNCHHEFHYSETQFSIPLEAGFVKDYINFVEELFYGNRN